jgi:multidrug efflux system membrane fusion protein
MTKKEIANTISIIIVVVFLASVVLVILRLDHRPRTSDSFLLADVANLAPEVSGRIVSFNVRDNQQVHAGDVLFVIDPKPYQFKLDAAKAQLVLAAGTLKRTIPLLGNGYVTAEEVDQLRASEQEARANQGLAQRDVDNTVVKAPFDGKVVGLENAIGEYAVEGHPLFTLIDTSKWYVVANFRETDIARMKPGDLVTVYVMSKPGIPLQGHVDSIGWGVMPEDAGITDGLPTLAKTLNWVRLAQRFPVRVLLDNPPADLMRLGTSAVTVVHCDD